MNKKLIIANWKMNPLTLREAQRIFDSSCSAADAADNVDLVIAPPFIYLNDLINYCNEESFGAQDVCWEDPTKGGAYTGEVSATMLKKMGVGYVIIGHSERRQYLQEADALIGKKLAATINAGMTAVLCVGEPNEVHKKGMSAVKQYIRKQLDGAFKGMKFTVLQSKKLVVAYEPIWAIGTGAPPTVEDAGEVIDFIRMILDAGYSIKQARILYGGSVNSKNIKGFLQRQGIDGALVGGASVNPKEFSKMIVITATI